MPASWRRIRWLSCRSPKRRAARRSPAASGKRTSSCSSCPTSAPRARACCASAHFLSSTEPTSPTASPSTTKTRSGGWRPSAGITGWHAACRTRWWSSRQTSSVWTPSILTTPSASRRRISARRICANSSATTTSISIRTGASIPTTCSAPTARWITYTTPRAPGTWAAISRPSPTNGRAKMQSSRPRATTSHGAWCPTARWLSRT